MKTNLSNVRLFVIDEISMVSSLNLAYIHMRLEELFSENEWFGSRNMMFVGDLLQLPPVAGSPVFEKVSTKSLLNQQGCAASANIWRDCVTYDELTINERQKNDPQFSSMLDSVRRGCPTEETVRIQSYRCPLLTSSLNCSNLAGHLFASSLRKEPVRFSMLKCSQKLHHPHVTFTVQMK